MAPVEYAGSRHASGAKPAQSAPRESQPLTQRGARLAYDQVDEIETFLSYRF